MLGNRKVKNLIIIILFLILIVYLFPIFLLIINSFKTFREIFTSFIAFPTKLNFVNYLTGIKALNIPRSLINNLIITSTTIIGVVLIPGMAGYKLCRYKSKLSSFFYLLFIVPFLIPAFTYMIPLVTLMKDLRLIDNPLGLTLIYIATGSFSLFVFYGYTKSIPLAIEESAYIDGASQIRIFFSIILPISAPAASSVAILYALWSWNDFLLPFLLLTSETSKTMMINVYLLFGKYGSDWDVITASLILASLPIIAIYVALQKYFIRSVAKGAVKG